jgi:hypothetical protein
MRRWIHRIGSVAVTGLALVATPLQAQHPGTGTDYDFYGRGRTPSTTSSSASSTR